MYHESYGDVHVIDSSATDAKLCARLELAVTSSVSHLSLFWEWKAKASKEAK
jgi:hypothetical protein